jgi:hypothetical protein
VLLLQVITLYFAIQEVKAAVTEQISQTKRDAEARCKRRRTAGLTYGDIRGSSACLCTALTSLHITATSCKWLRSINMLSMLHECMICSAGV